MKYIDSVFNFLSELINFSTNQTANNHIHTNTGSYAQPKPHCSASPKQITHHHNNRPSNKQHTLNFKRTQLIKRRREPTSRTHTYRTCPRTRIIGRFKNRFPVFKFLFLFTFRRLSAVVRPLFQRLTVSEDRLVSCERPAEPLTDSARPLWPGWTLPMGFGLFVVYI